MCRESGDKILPDAVVAGADATLDPHGGALRGGLAAL
jgi:hypothetical protein